MKQILLLFGFFYTTAIYAQSTDEAAVRELLQQQVKSWNCGDLRGFMKGYWQHDSLLFIGKNGITYGFKQVLEQYRKSYPDMDAMGELSFDILKVEMINKESCFVVGKWHLKRDSMGDASGHFTLLLRKLQGEWVIVADHSS